MGVSGEGIPPMLTTPVQGCLDGVPGVAPSKPSRMASAQRSTPSFGLVGRGGLSLRLPVPKVLADVLGEGGSWRCCLAIKTHVLEVDAVTDAAVPVAIVPLEDTVEALTGCRLPNVCDACIGDAVLV